MKLGEIARVTRGVVTGNRSLFILPRSRARQLGIEQFVRPIVSGSKELPRNGPAIVRDQPDREVLIVASRQDLERNDGLRAYIGATVPRVVSVRSAPIVVTYIGTPRFAANPDGLIATNSLYTVTPRQPMQYDEVLAFVERLNVAAKQHMPNSGTQAQRRSPRELETLEIG